MATSSSILAWRIPWTGSLAGYSPRGRKESDTTEVKHSLFEYVNIMLLRFLSYVILFINYSIYIKHFLYTYMCVLSHLGHI